MATPRKPAVEKPPTPAKAGSGSATYLVLSAVKVGGKWRGVGDPLVGLSPAEIAQLAGRIEPVLDEAEG